MPKIFAAPAGEKGKKKTSTGPKAAEDEEKEDKRTAVDNRALLHSQFI